MKPTRQPILPAVPAPREPAAAGRAAGDALAALLSALAAPLNFLAAAPPGTAERTRLPTAKLLERIAALLAHMPPGPLRRDLEALRDTLAAYDTATAEQRRAHVDRCRALVDRLQHGSPEELPPYRRTTESIADHLQALAQSAQFLAGMGPRRAEQLKKLGVATVEDLLYHLPFRYEDRRAVRAIRDLRAGDVASVIGEITHLTERHVGRSQRRILEAVLRDDTGLLGLVWFHKISYFRDRYAVGQRVLVHGKVEGSAMGEKRIAHPEVELSPDLDGQGVLPVYNKPTTMSVGVMRKIVQDAVAAWAHRLPSVLPDAVVQRAGITDLPQAMQRLHIPGREADVAALNDSRSGAHRSLVFDELFFLQLGMALRRRSVEIESGIVLPERGTLTRQLRSVLPFRLTGAQERVIREVLADMARPHPLHRLIQGDVGSGKTIVALFAALVAIENEYQAVFMAPTELLAEQHFATVTRFTEALGVRTVLLTSQLTRAQRRKVYERIESGEIQLAVGTQALIQEGVRFKALGLGVIDEQHRFGVLQRAALRQLGPVGLGPVGLGPVGLGPVGLGPVGLGPVGLGAVPDILLMTATPIPRTLAMTVYGDLDISVLDELPPGRQPVRTLLRHEGERARVYDLVTRELDRGRQAYVVYPLVDSSDTTELRAATTMARELAQAVFARYRVGLLHGRMKAAEKDAVMRRFKAGEVQVLVSTTVIEVGIDVPNATVMVVEHAERFGLAQLHQLRGRVGRGSDQSLCVLVTPYHRGEEARRRLEALAATTDGFRIAEVDLEIRGPGEMLGTRQSGLPDFRVANLVRDQRILADARQAAVEWLQTDPRLERPESQALRTVLRHRWAGRLELAEIG